MLVLGRKLNERILIGDDIVITVAAINGDHVRLGIEAPRDIAVDREEVRWRKMLDWWRRQEQ
jgi:carbon storage regulator